MPTYDTALVTMLYGLLRHIEQAFRLQIAILIHMEVQVQVPVLRQPEDPDRGN